MLKSTHTQQIMAKKLTERAGRLRVALIANLTLPLMLAACSPPAPQVPSAVQDMPPFQAAYSIDDLMDYMITPAAEAYWGSVSIHIDRDGITENFPTTDAEWDAVMAAAVTLAESGNLLMLPSRALPGRDWMRLSREMVAAGVAAANAASSRDVDAVFDAGERVYNACSACHDQYLVNPAALTFPPPD